MYKTLSIALIALVATTTMSFAQYSTGFEYADLTAMQADGWLFTQWTPNFETTIVHSGQQALRLQARVCVEYPLSGEFGTLNMWVYDEGLTPEPNADGYRWGMRKGQEVLAAFLGARSWYDSSLVYAANDGWSSNAPLAQWFSWTWLDAGDPAARSRLTPGWRNWEFVYNPDGTVEINLLIDPDGGGAKGHASHPVGTGVAPHNDGGAGDSIEFADPGTGGVDAVYLFGTWSNDGGTPAIGPFGDLIVDDLTWTPAAAGKPGDADGDGDIDLDDFVILKNEFGLTTPPLQADFDNDGDVDLDDFVILKNNFGL